MKYIIVTFFLTLVLFAKATVQVPELLVIQNDTVFLLNFPMEENKPRDIESRLDSFAYMNNNLCTACHRSYQGVWELRDEKLYFNEVRECCYTARYWITKYNLRILKEKGVRNDIVDFLETKGLNKAYWDFEIKKILKSRFKKKELTKALPVIYKYTKNCLQKMDGGMLLSVNQKVGSLFASWYSGKLYFVHNKVKYILTIKDGNIIDKEAVLSNDDIFPYFPLGNYK